MDDEVMYEKTSLTSGVLGKTFLWMFMGLLATAFISWYSYSSGFVLKTNYQLLLLAEFVVVLVFSLGFRKLPATVVTILYFGYAILNGFTFSVIFYIFELNSIISLFFVTAGMFGVLAYIGMKTERDLTSFGNFVYAGLFAGVIVTLINLIMKNSTVDIVLDWVMLVIFLGITVYDVNKIKNMEEYNIVEPDKLYIYGAMEIYLDFINIFIRLLSLFGKRK